MTFSVGDAHISLSVDMNPLSRAFQQGGRDVQRWGDQVEREVRDTTGKFSALKSAIGGVFTGIGIGVASAGFGVLQGAIGGVGEAIFGLNNEAEAAQARINAFTKDAGKTAEILEMVRARAAKTPFAFSEMASAAGALIPVGRQANLSLESLMQTAEILAASNPLEGLEGASFALREAMTGDFASIIERFNLSRSSINKWKEEGLSNFEIVQRAMKEMGFDADLVGAMGETMSGRWSTFLDTIDQIKIKATSSIFEGLKGGLVTIQGALDANMPRIEAFATMVGEKLGSAVQWGVDHIDDLFSLLRDGYEIFDSARDAVSRLWDAFTRTGDFNSAFGPILELIEKAFGEEARNKAVLFVSGALTEFQRLRDAVLTFGQAFGGNWADSDKIASPFVRAVGRVGTEFFNIKETAKQAFGGDWVDSDTISSPIVRGVGIAASKLGDLKRTADEIFGIFRTSGAQNAAQSIVSRIFGADAGEEFSATINTLRETFGPFADAVRDFDYGGFFKQMADEAKELWAASAPVRDVIADLYLKVSPLGAIVSAVTGEFNIWTDLFRTLQPLFLSIGGVFVGIAGAIKPIGDQFRDVGNVFREQWPQMQQIGGQLMELWTAIQPVIGAVATVVGGVLVGAVGVAVSVLGGLVGLFGGILPGVLQTFSGALDVAIGVFNQVTLVFRTGVEVIKNLFEGDLQGAIDAFTGNWGEMRDNSLQILNGLWTAITGIFEGIVGGVLGLIEGFVETFAGYFVSIYDRVMGTTTDLKFDFTDMLGDMISDAWGKVIQFKDNVVGKFGDLRDGVLGAASDLKTRLTNSWDELKGGLERSATTLKDNITGTFENAKEGIKNAILWPFERARDLIGGIVGGLKDNMLSPLRSALGSIGRFGSGFASVFNWIAGKIKPDAQIGTPPIPELSKGTTGYQGWAWVGEGPGGAGAELARLGPGSVVIPHRESVAIAKQVGIPLPTKGAKPGFVGGLNLGDIFSFFNAPEKLLQMAIDAVGGWGGFEIPGIPGIGGAVVDRVKGWIVSKITDFIKSVIPVSPDQVQNMIRFAESQMGLPYIWGGGHGGLGGPGIGFDCSGFVAAVLDAGGIRNPHGIVTDFYEWMVKNGGNGIVDIGVNNPYAAPDVQHIGIRLMGTQYESGGPFGGTGKNGTRFSEWGVPPGWESARGLSGSSALDNVDWRRSLSNMNRGRVGQWGGIAMAQGGVIDEPIAGVGLDTGARYIMGEVGKELVIPADMMQWLYLYAMRVMMTGQADNEYLRYFPQEMRETIRNIARRYVASRGPIDTASLPGGPRAVDPSGNPIGGAATPFGEELIPNPFPIVPMPADPVADATEPKTDSGAGAGTGAGTPASGGGVARLVVEAITNLKIGGYEISETVVSDGAAIDLMAGGVTRVQANRIAGKIANPADLPGGPPPKTPSGGFLPR